MKGYSVQPITYDETKSWLLHRHYAKRMPPISYAFGLFKGADLVGICTFGRIANYQEDKAWQPFQVLEFNRLCLNTGKKNAASFLIGKALNQLEKPHVIISYADFRQGHVGYVYQATNWLYTGIGGKGQKIYILKNGTQQHQRHGETIDKDKIERIEKTEGKARYYYFIGTKRQKKEMLAKLRYPILPYPKGETRRYEVPETQERQLRLFA